MTTNYEKHYPVMLSEIIEFLSPKDGEIYVDGTFGAGGYSSKILETSKCQVIGIDRDDDVIAEAKPILEKYGDRIKLLKGKFSQMKELLHKNNIDKVDGIVLDLGVSSMQIDRAERGFSIKHDGPLDMRMSREGESASDFLNNATEETISNVIYKYGEERMSRQITKKIIENRPINTTKQLADIVHSVVKKKPKDTGDTATRTFQAIRIYINEELKELEEVLEQSKDLLNPEGRLVIVTFHSLEDRIVKHFLKKASGNVSNSSRYMPDIEKPKVFFKITKNKAILPTDKEIQENYRSRSAKLRFAIKV
jgi:16S rRNA (cytosine1402-N4)-methyltransferase